MQLSNEYMKRKDDTMIKVHQLSKSFDGFLALNHLTMHVEKGNVYGLVGPNGAGKTTVIKHITGVLRQDSGKVLVKGEPVFDNVGVKDGLVYIPDDVFFFHSYTVRDMKKYYARIYPRWNEARYNHLKDVFGIDEKRRVARLSKGMKKQVAFWLGISAMPDIMVLDEPVDGLDPVMRRKVWSLLLQDVAEREMTVLISSHNLRELEDVCDHVGILHQGKVVLEKRLDDLKSDVHKIQVAFSGEMPQELLDTLKPMNCTEFGKVHLLIVRGEYEALTAEIEKYKPLLIDILPLTLEEIFIYELGGLGYEITDVIL